MTESMTLDDFKELLAGELPELGPGPRAGAMPLETLDKKLGQLFAKSSLPAQSRELIRGLLLLWHDHHEPAHVIAQDIENADGSLLHAILHRREPDCGNAAYWFRRVGKHECFPAIAERVENLLHAKNEIALQKQLIHNGEWDASAFIKAYEEAGRIGQKKSDERITLLREIQGIESEEFLKHLLAV